MARAHVGKGLIISLDLKDFFTSIKQYHLFQVFQHIGFEKDPARTLSELCTYGAFVPQGALTSPKLSNIVTSLTFGPIIKEYCDRHGYTVTIYADDVTISMDEDLVKQRGYGAVEEIVEFVSRTVQSFGFRVNRRKTKVMRPFQRQYVCGVVVNRMPNLQKTERRKLRAIVHNVKKNGLKAEATKSGLTPDSFRSKLMGQLNWFGQLNPEAGARLIDDLRQILVLGQEPSKVSDGGVKSIVFPDITNTASENSSAAEAPWS